MKTIKLTAVLSSIALSFSLLTGCASIVNGANQNVSVKTANVQGATCSLTNDKGVWHVNSTPGSVVVHRSYKELAINCHKKSYRDALTNIPSKTKAMAFGNLVFGGVIGAGVDVATGSAYDYPDSIEVPMIRA